MNPIYLHAMCTSFKSNGIFAKLAPSFADQHFRKKSNQILEAFFYLSLKKVGIEVLLECGAHDASASIKARSLGLSAIAIEANPLTFQSKTIKSKSYGVDAMNVGLSSKQGSLVFYLPAINKEAGNATFQKKSNEI
jgi:hypothetical protein